MPFSIDFDRRPYNTLALPCECVILTPQPTISIILTLRVLVSILADFSKTEICNMGLNTLPNLLLEQCHRYEKNMGGNLRELYYKLLYVAL